MVIKMLKTALANKKGRFSCTHGKQTVVFQRNRSNYLSTHIKMVHTVRRWWLNSPCKQEKEDFHVHIVSKHSVLIATSWDHVVKKL